MSKGGDIGIMSQWIKARSTHCLDMYYTSRRNRMNKYTEHNWEKYVIPFGCCTSYLGDYVENDYWENFGYPGKKFNLM